MVGPQGPEGSLGPPADLSAVEAVLANLESRVTALEQQSTFTDPLVALRQAVLDVLGPTGVVLPLVEAGAGFNTRTFTTLSAGPEQFTFTWSKRLANFSIPPSTGTIPVITLNGSDEVADSADADYWTGSADGTAANEPTFSMGAWVNLAGAPRASTIFSKFREVTPVSKAYTFFLDASHRPRIDIIDESSNAIVGKRVSTPLPLNEWHFVVATYDGSGASSGVAIYIDGIAVGDTDINAGTYVAMENTSEKVSLGHVVSFGDEPGDKFRGALAGGPIGPFFTNTELSAVEVLQLSDLGFTALSP